MHLTHLTWPQVGSLVPRTPVVVPIAALEQHGPHMPVFTDSLLLEEIVRRVEAEISDQVLFAPVMWLGNSEHHLDFPGTLTASPRTYLNLLVELADNLLTHGFRTILLLNGHGGNIVPAQQALFELRQRHRNRGDLQLLSATYWQLGEPPNAEDSSLSQSQMGHAGEWETSMMLALRPDLVGDHQSLPPVSRAQPFEPAHQAWITRERSSEGYLGDPASASTAKGERLFGRFSSDVVRLLDRVVSFGDSTINP